MTAFERIKELARKQGLSLIEVNDKAGLGTRTIYHWKNQVPKSDSLTAVAKVLHTSADYLLGNTDDPSPVSKEKNSGVVDLDHDQVFSYRGRHVPEKYLKMVKELMDADIDEDDDNGEWLN
ncbi:XRE family transcriptional regulator [Lactobacillus sp. XV13L]|nr:XRE family transcriptional regulator [Lactobacillus sp. XV13L]